MPEINTPLLILSITISLIIPMGILLFGSHRPRKPPHKPRNE